MADHHQEAQRIVAALDQRASVLVAHYVRATVAACDGNISHAARRLGMHRRTIQRMLAKRPPKITRRRANG